MLPGEAVTAIALEVSDRPTPRILATLSKLDSYDDVSLPADSAPTIRCSKRWPCPRSASRRVSARSVRTPAAPWRIVATPREGLRDATVPRSACSFMNASPAIRCAAADGDAVLL